MFFVVSIALLIVNFVTCTTFARADNIVNYPEIRHLCVQAGNVPVVFSRAKIVEEFLSTAKEKALRAKALKKIMTTGDVSGATNLATRIKAAARLSDDEVAKLAKLIGESKNSKWDGLRKRIKATPGAGGLAI